MNRADAEQALTEWKQRTDAAAAERDRIIRAAHAAGVSITRISRLTGLSRVTIYKILGVEEDPAEGKASGGPGHMYMTGGICSTCGKPVPGGGHTDDCTGLVPETQYIIGGGGASQSQ